MLSKDAVKTLKFLHKYGQTYIVKDQIPRYLAHIDNLFDILEFLKEQQLIEEVGAHTIHLPTFSEPIFESTHEYKILPAGIASLEHIPVDFRRMWVPVILSTVLSIIAIIMSVIALMLQLRE